MRRILLAAALLTIGCTAFAQEPEEKNEEKKGGFKKDHLFTGGGITLSFSGNTFVAGASPVFGYSINKWLDAGILFNFLYTSSRPVIYDPYTNNYYYSDDKYRYTSYGPGAFVRFYPLNFLFVQGQVEQNYMRAKEIIANGPTNTYKVSAPSLLLGVGYASGREQVGDLFYYVSLAVDVIKDRNSPYVGITESNNVVMQPIIRAGLQVPLFQGKNRRW
jgi:hypothetical protein